jgi:hypothetical protein
MADRNGTASGSGALLSGVAGALLGAAGLAWWLLSEAEKRRLEGRQQRVLRLSRLHDGVSEDDGQEQRSRRAGQGQQELHHKVHELNQAIEDVRRQLEGMATSR